MRYQFQITGVNAFLGIKTSHSITSLPIEPLIDQSASPAAAIWIRRSVCCKLFVVSPRPHRHELTFSSSTTKRRICWKRLLKTLLFIRSVSPRHHLSLSFAFSPSLALRKRSVDLKGPCVVFSALGISSHCVSTPQLNADVSTSLIERTAADTSDINLSGAVPNHTERVVRNCAR